MPTTRWPMSTPLTAEGTTHGFERGYDAFLGDPFGAETVAGNLGVTVGLAGLGVAQGPKIKKAAGIAPGGSLTLLQ